MLVEGDDELWRAGSDFAGNRDLDGDGVIDLLLGAAGAEGDEDSSGAVYLFSGSP